MNDEREWLDRNEAGHETTEGHYSQRQIEEGIEVQQLDIQRQAAMTDPILKLCEKWDAEPAEEARQMNAQRILEARGARP